MWRTTCALYPNRVLVAALMAALVVGAQVRAAAETDPHRPGCVDARCRKAESFVRSHYCGVSPYGNGPEGGCGVRIPRGARPGVDVLAQAECGWNEKKKAAECKQHGVPSAFVRTILLRELRRLGLPANVGEQAYFTVWKSSAPGWLLAAANYSRTAGSDLELCQVIVIIDQGSHVQVLREVPFRKTDADTPAVTLWSPVDLADADGDGHADVILQGDAYEDHWLEVVTVLRGSHRTLFSGLGYYL